jgi:penicillin-binding protein 2
MQEGLLTPETSIACHTSPMHCHPHPSPQKLMGGVIYSCNSYFFHVFKRIVNRGESSSPFVDIRYGMAKWSAYVEKFGYGTKLGVDMPNEKRGKVPTIAMYDKMYGERRWKFSTIYSISIGEGEYSVNPIQLANFVSCIANKGWWITPHFIQKIGDKGTLPEQYLKRHETGVAPEHFEYLHDCMEQVILAGMTVWKRGVVMDSVVICGKTGTSQNAKGKDHSIFIGFAPKENPKIAIACLVENAGFGGYAAAPIASLMIERFIKRRTIRKNLKQFMTDKEYLTPIERAVRRAQHLQDSLRRMEDSATRGINKIVASTR